MLHESRGHKEVRDNASNVFDSAQDKPVSLCQSCIYMIYLGNEMFGS